METINEYTLVELLNLFKKYIVEDMEHFLEDIGLDAQTVELITIEAKGMCGNKYKKQELKEKIFEIVCASFSGKSENTQKEHKLSFLGRIYRGYFSSMNKEDAKRIKNLLLEGASYTVLKFQENDKYKGFMIITEEPRKKLSNIKSNKSKKNVEEAIEVAMYCDEAYSLIDAKHPGLSKIIEKIVEDYSNEEKKAFFLDNLNLFLVLP